MRKNIVALVMLCSSVAALGMSAPARAQVGQNSIGPSVAIGNGTTAIGIDSKFGVNESLSIRPFIYFPSGSTDFGAALTYDFNLRNPGNQVQITPFLGGAVDVESGGGSSVTTVSFVGGADFDVTDNIQLKGGLNVPLSNSNGQTTFFTLGAGFRF